MTSYRKPLLFLALVGFMTPGIAAAERLSYEVIEDVFDDTTGARTLTEQAPVADGKGWLIRTTLFASFGNTMEVVFVPVSTTKKGLFDPIP
jgi:hypothetical protein